MHAVCMWHSAHVIHDEVKSNRKGKTKEVADSFCQSGSCWLEKENHFIQSPLESRHAFVPEISPVAV